MNMGLIFINRRCAHNRSPSQRGAHRATAVSLIHYVGHRLLSLMRTLPYKQLENFNSELQRLVDSSVRAMGRSKNTVLISQRCHKGLDCGNDA